MTALQEQPEALAASVRARPGKRRRARLGKRPVRRRLTLAGWLFLLLAVLIGLAAVRSQAPLLFFLCGTMLGAVAFSAFVAGRTIRYVQARRQVPARAWQKQVVHVGYYLRNARRGGSSLSLRLQEWNHPDLESVAGYCVDLPTGRLFRSGARFTPRHRGRVDLKGLEISTTFPFGLVLARCRTQQSSSLIIWPEKGRLCRRLLHRGAAEVSHAPPSRDSGGQDEFFGLREYRSGDNPRWIHWRRTATLGTPVLREMARPLPEVLWLVLDTTRNPETFHDVDAFERSLRFAATLTDHAMVRGYEVGLALGGDSGPVLLRPGAGRGQRCAVLDAIATAQPAEGPFADVVDALAAARPREAQVIVISAQPGPAPRCIDPLRGRCRHLTYLGAAQLRSVFQDLPSGHPEAAPCP